MRVMFDTRGNMLHSECQMASVPSCTVPFHSKVFFRNVDNLCCEKLCQIKHDFKIVSVIDLKFLMGVLVKI